MFFLSIISIILVFISLYVHHIINTPIIPDCQTTLKINISDHRSTLKGFYLLSVIPNENLKGNGLEINFTGLGIVMLSSLFYALYMVIVNKSNMKVSGFKLTFYSMVFTSMFFMTKAVAANESFAIPSVEIFLNFLIFAFLTTVISSLCLVYAIKYIGSTPVSILGALEPVVAVLISVLMFHERFTSNLLIGITLILFGVTLNVIGDQKKIGHA
jgi:drug/metabolite transporter (DMT)-like permease